MNKPLLPLHARRESGNVLFLILLIVAVVAVISYVVTQGGSGHPRPNHNKGAISSASVMQYAKSIKKGVKRLTDKGVALNDIEFYAPIDSHFTEMAETETSKTLLFHPDGGGVTYFPVDSDDVEKRIRSLRRHQNGNWYFSHVKVRRVGTYRKEIVAILDYVKKDTCSEINQEITGNADIPQVDISSDDIIESKRRLKGARIDGQPSFCVKTLDHYLFYSVLAQQ